MHTETGFCKVMLGSGECTMQQAHPFPSGFISELSEGKLSEGGNVMTLVAKDFQRAKKEDNNEKDGSGSKKLTGFKRVYEVDAAKGKLKYDQYLSSGGCDLFHHLHCEMERVVEPVPGQST